MYGCRLAPGLLYQPLRKENECLGVQGHVKVQASIEVAQTVLFELCVHECWPVGSCFGWTKLVALTWVKSPDAPSLSTASAQPKRAVEAKQRPRYATRLTNPSPHVMFASKSNGSLRQTAQMLQSFWRKVCFCEHAC